MLHKYLRGGLLSNDEYVAMATHLVRHHGTNQWPQRHQDDIISHLPRWLDNHAENDDASILPYLRLMIKCARFQQYNIAVFIHNKRHRRCLIKKSASHIIPHIIILTDEESKAFLQLLVILFVHHEPSRDQSIQALSEIAEQDGTQRVPWRARANLRFAFNLFTSLIKGSTSCILRLLKYKVAFFHIKGYTTLTLTQFGLLPHHYKNKCLLLVKLLPQLGASAAVYRLYQHILGIPQPDFDAYNTLVKEMRAPTPSPWLAILLVFHGTQFLPIDRVYDYLLRLTREKNDLPQAVMNEVFIFILKLYWRKAKWAAIIQIMDSSSFDKTVMIVPEITLADAYIKTTRCVEAESRILRVISFAEEETTVTSMWLIATLTSSLVRVKLTNNDKDGAAAAMKDLRQHILDLNEHDVFRKDEMILAMLTCFHLYDQTMASKQLDWFRRTVVRKQLLSSAELESLEESFHLRQHLEHKRNLRNRLRRKKRQHRGQQGESQQDRGGLARFVGNTSDSYSSESPPKSPPAPIAHEEEEECSVCFMPMDNDDNHHLRCGHIYHKECIESWYGKCIKGGLPRTCPMCRDACVT